MPTRSARLGMAKVFANASTSMLERIGFKSGPLLQADVVERADGPFELGAEHRQKSLPARARRVSRC